MIHARAHIRIQGDTTRVGFASLPHHRGNMEHGDIRRRACVLAATSSQCLDFLYVFFGQLPRGGGGGGPPPGPPPPRGKTKQPNPPRPGAKVGQPRQAIEKLPVRLPKLAWHESEKSRRVSLLRPRQYEDTTKAPLPPRPSRPGDRRAPVANQGGRLTAHPTWDTALLPPPSTTK